MRSVFPFSLFPNFQTRTARMTTRQHLSGQSRKATKCFVLDDCDDDTEIFVNIVDRKVSLSMEPPKQTSSTPIVFNVDTGEENIPDIRTANHDDGLWSSEDEHTSDRNTRFKHGTYRGVLNGDDLRDYITQTCANFSLGHINIMALMQRFLFLIGNRRRVLKWAKKRASSKESIRHLVRTKPKIRHGSKTALFIACLQRNTSGINKPR